MRRTRWIDIGPWSFGFENPFRFAKRPGKDWACNNDACPEAYAGLRRLSEFPNGCCRRCGKSGVRVRWPQRP